MMQLDLFGKTTKAQARQNAATEEHRAVLNKWFARSGWTWDRLSAEIHKQRAGVIKECPPALIAAAHADPMNAAWKLAVIMAGQHFAWRGVVS